MADIRILEDWDYPQLIVNQNKVTTSNIDSKSAVTIRDEDSRRAAFPVTTSTDIPSQGRGVEDSRRAASRVATLQDTVPTGRDGEDSRRALSPVAISQGSVFRGREDDDSRRAAAPVRIDENFTPRGIAGEDSQRAGAVGIISGVSAPISLSTQDETIIPIVTEDVVVKDGEPSGDGKPSGDGEPDKPPVGDANAQFVEYEYNKDFTKRRSKFFNSKTGAFTYGEWEDAPKTKEDFDKEQARIAAEESALNDKRDSFALIEATMRSYGFNEEELKEITDYISAGLINPKLGSNQLLLQLRQLESYKSRFAGNEQRRARGLNALSEAAYLAQERDYAQTLALYGQDRFVNRQQLAQFIGNDISNTELSQRVATAVNRLQNADPVVLKQLSEYYPNINEKDVISYFLSPEETLPELQAKTTTAEIGATARQYGLDYGMSKASELQKYGVNLERARTGFKNIAEVLPRSKELSEFYKASGINYNQEIAEQEEFKGLASARRAREKLKELEIATFSGQSGLSKNALRRSTGGQF